jgi:hypothetical protein
MCWTVASTPDVNARARHNKDSWSDSSAETAQFTVTSTVAVVFKRPSARQRERQNWPPRANWHARQTHRRARNRSPVRCSYTTCSVAVRYHRCMNRASSALWKIQCLPWLQLMWDSTSAGCQCRLFRCSTSFDQELRHRLRHMGASSCTRTFNTTALSREPTC